MGLSVRRSALGYCACICLVLFLGCVSSDDRSTGDESNLPVDVGIPVYPAEPNEPSAIELMALRVSETSLRLVKGFSAQLALKLIYSDGSEQPLEEGQWHSSDETVVQVTAQGLLAVGEGEAHVHASWQGVISEPVAISVTEAELSGLMITPETASVYRGSHHGFQALASFSDGMTQDVTTDPKISWQTSSPEVASIDEQGVAQGLQLGQTDIQARLMAGAPAESATTTASLQAANESSVFISNSVPLTVQQRPDATLRDYEIASYLPYWGIANYRQYNYQSLSTLIIILGMAKQTVLEDDILIAGDNKSRSVPYDMGEMVDFMRSSNPDLKIILSLAPKEGADELVNDPTLRAKTIDYLLDHYVDRYDLDGLDLNFEGTHLDAAVAYPEFTRALASALHDTEARQRRTLLLITLGTHDFDHSNVNQTLYDSADLIQVMDYGPVKMDVDFWWDNRNLHYNFANWSRYVPAQKLSFGLSGWSTKVLYGQLLGGGKNFSDILKVAPGSNGYTPYLTTSYRTGDSTDEVGTILRYNSLHEIRRKAEFIKSKQGRGVFYWALNYDPTSERDQQYSPLSLLNDWYQHPKKYPPMVAATTQDFYRLGNTIAAHYHSLAAPYYDIWVGVYDFESDESIGYLQYLPEYSERGTVVIPANVVGRLSAGQLYILKFYRGLNGQANELLGSSHPFYRLPN